MERLLSLVAACVGAVFTFVGVHMLWADRLVRVQGLVMLSRETVGYGLGVACAAALSFEGAPAEGISVHTEGPCPAVAPNLSEVDVCHPIGRPTHAAIGCQSTFLAIAYTLLGGVFLFYPFLECCTAHVGGVARTDGDVIDLLPHAFQTVHLSRPPTPAISEQRRLDSYV
jgi:hypothetical protein